MKDIELNEDQVTAILTEGLNRELYECLNGALPEDQAVRSSDAHQLVQIAKNAFDNGNRSDNVQTILFIAQSDQKPLPAKEQKIVEAVANGDMHIAEKRESVTSTFHNGIDLATLSDGVIEGLIIGLDKYPPSEQVEEDRKAYLAEKERRNEKNSQIKDDPQDTTPQEAPEKAGEATPEGSPTQSEMADQDVESSRIQSGIVDSKGIGASAGSTDSAKGEDAGAFARAQTPETSPEGKQAKAKPIEEDGKRSALEEQLTLPIVKAHAVDITRLGSLPIAQIEFILENPDGPPTEEKDMAVSESEIEASVKPKDEKAVAGIAADVPVEEKVITKADLGLEVDETTGEISADGLDRENLEAQITGPTLKAYGRGRKEIPSMGINELKFMVDNPDAKVDPSELEAAKKIDNLGKKVVEVVREVDAEEDEKKDRTVGEAAKEAVIKSPPVEEASSFIIREEPKTIVNGGEQKLYIDDSRQKNRVMEIISQEGMPIPPNYKDEEAPVFPMDVSQCSRDELFSLHAKYHAYEMRINVVLCEHEDRVSDLAQLRNYREAVVAKSIPFMGEDGKRNTNEYRDAQVKGDKEVLILGEKEHDVKKIVTDLKVHQKNYHLSCERLSRQMSKYETERIDSPR